VFVQLFGVSEPRVATETTVRVVSLRARKNRKDEKLNAGRSGRRSGDATRNAAHLQMQPVLLVAREHFAALVAHEPVAASVAGRVHVLGEFAFAVERPPAAQADRARVAVHVLAVRVQRPFLDERFRAVLALQHGRGARRGAVRRGHVRGQRLAAVARHTARATAVARMAVHVKLVVTAVGERPLAVTASITHGHGSHDVRVITFTRRAARLTFRTTGASALGSSAHPFARLTSHRRTRRERLERVNKDNVAITAAPND